MFWKPRAPATSNVKDAPAPKAQSIVVNALDRVLESPKLVQMMSKQAAKMLGAKSGFLPLKWDGLNGESAGFVAVGMPERALTALRAAGLTASCSLAEIAQKKIRVDRFTIARLQVAFSKETAGALQNDLSQEPQLFDPSEKDGEFRLDIRETDIQSVDLLFGNPRAGGSFRGVTVDLWPDGPNLVASGYGGSFALSGLPKMEIREFKVHYAKPDLRLDAATMLVGLRGAIDVKGDVVFTQPGKMDIKLQFSKCDLKDFLTGAFRSKLSGAFDGDANVKEQFGSEEQTSVEGSVKCTGTELHDIDALRKLADFTGESAFRRLHLQVISGKYRWQAAALEVSDFVAESRGLLRLQGSFTLKAGNIHGRLQLGVSARVLKSFPGAREEVFTRSHDGYFWTAISPAGPMKDAGSELKQRLVAAAERHFAKLLLAPILKPGHAILERLRVLF